MKPGLSQGISSATNGSSALKIDSNAIPSGNSNITGFPGNNSNVKENISSSSGNNNVIDFPGNNSSNKNNINKENNAGNPEPGQKVTPGQKINEEGKVEDTSTKKLLRSGARVGAAAATAGQSETSGIASEVSRMKPVDQALGVVSDQAEKIPGVETVAKELDDAGISDGVNDALNIVSDVKNADLKNGVEDAKKVLKDTKKLKKFLLKKFAVPIAISLFNLMIIIFFICMASDTAGSVIDLTKYTISSIAENIWDGITDLFDGDDEEIIINDDDVNKLLADIPNYSSLSASRKKILAAAAIPIAQHIPYNWGGHPNGPGVSGIPSGGLDCAGYVQWALWTGLGSNPGYLTTAEISNSIGSKFIEISESELQPGDIGLKRNADSGHTGIYAGNGNWFHAYCTNCGIVRSKYTNFTRYLRYVGVN